MKSSTGTAAVLLAGVLVLAGLGLRTAGQGAAGQGAAGQGAARQDPGAVVESFEPPSTVAGTLERFLFNPVERTRRGLDSADRGEMEAAVQPLEEALELAPESSVARYNVGTARLSADRPGALALLQESAERAAAGSRTDPELLSNVYYNLGNARMKDEELAAAVEAYKDALRHDSDFEDAKYNLELAQRLLEQRQQQQEQGDENEEQGEQEEKEEQQEKQEQQPQEPPPQDGEDPQEQGNQEQQPSPLPQFRDLPDMTAEEAAAILEAVENMERERRREEARKAAQLRVGGKKDW